MQALRSRWSRWYRANRPALHAEGLRFLMTATKWGCVGAVIGTHVVSFISCEGPSMLPTFNQSGDWLMAERLTAPKSLLSRPLAAVGLKLRVGDVVWCRSPRDPTSTVVKRVVALGGEEVPVLVNDIFGERVVMKSVPIGSVWLHGDNLADSTDSRDYGAVPLALVNGKVLFRIRPWHSIALVRNSTAFLSTAGHALHAQTLTESSAATATATAVDEATAALNATATATIVARPVAASSAAAAATVEPRAGQWGAAVVHHRVALAQRTDSKAPASAATAAASAAASTAAAPTSTASSQTSTAASKATAANANPTLR